MIVVKIKIDFKEIMKKVLLLLVLTTFTTASYSQNAFGGVGTYNQSGFGIGFQFHYQGPNKIGSITRLIDNWGNQNKVAFQAYEFGTGISYQVFAVNEETSVMVSGLPVISYQRQSDEDDNTLKQFNYGANGIISMNFSTANNSILGLFISKAIYNKNFTGIERTRIGISYSFY